MRKHCKLIGNSGGSSLGDFNKWITNNTVKNSILYANCFRCETRLALSIDIQNRSKLRIPDKLH